jgi:Flp pilus assembly protein TadG
MHPSPRQHAVVPRRLVVQSRSKGPFRRLGRLRPRTRGQALVEFVLIAPVLLLLLAVALDFGRLFFTYVQTNNAAREAANYGAQSPTDLATMTSRANGEKSGQLQRGESTITVSATCANALGTTILCSSASGGTGPGNTITVNVRAPFTFLTPIIGTVFGGNLQLNASATSAVRGYAAGPGSSNPGTCSAPLAQFTAIVTSGRDIFADPSASTPNSGVCNISGYNWTWGDGSDDVGTASGSPHSYASDGTYTIVLEVTNQGGRNTRSFDITISGPPPSAPPSAAPSAPPSAPACTKPSPNFTWTKQGKTYTYRDASTVADPVNCPITDWLWTFTDANGLQSNAQNPAPVTYGNNSNHPVTLKVTNLAGFNLITLNT